VAGSRCEATTDAPDPTPTIWRLIGEALDCKAEAAPSPFDMNRKLARPLTPTPSRRRRQDTSPAICRNGVHLKPERLAMAKKSREEIDHYVLDQFEQERHLGIGHEMTKNLGHDWRESEIEKNPAGKLMNYDSGDTARTFRDPAKLQGVYKKTADPRSGISSADNLARWSGYASMSSFDGKDGKAPSMPDPRERAAGYRPNGEGSDGHLLRPEWDRYEYGADSGPGRLEKTHRK
jgi:hypothetical protein